MKVLQVHPSQSGTKSMMPFITDTPKQECKSLAEASSYTILQKTFHTFLWTPR